MRFGGWRLTSEGTPSSVEVVSLWFCCERLGELMLVLEVFSRTMFVPDHNNDYFFCQTCPFGSTGTSYNTVLGIHFCFLLGERSRREGIQAWLRLE